MQLRHEPDRQRFVAVLEKGEGVLEYRAHGDGVLDYYHTFVPRELRGQGVAGRLVEFALKYAREQGLKVEPSCPFVAKVLESDAYRDLRAR